MKSELTSAEKLRYARHISISEIGVEGQVRLKNASVLLIGTGGLGSPAAMYLAAAGIGKLGLVDPDVVEVSNLQRQILHGESWLGKSKLASAGERLRELNPALELDLHPVCFSPDNAVELVESYDVILDGSDNFPTRFLANDCAFFARKPLIYGAIQRFAGQFSVFAPHVAGPCYRCILPEVPAAGAVPSCNEAGVLGALPGIIGTLQAMETLKWILKIGDSPLGRLVAYDALHSSFRTLTISRDPTCRLCGERPEIHSVKNRETTAAAICRMSEGSANSINIAELKVVLKNGFAGLLLDVREPGEYALGAIPQAQLVPLRQFAQSIGDFPVTQEIYVYCKSGKRSAHAIEMLKNRGILHAKNIIGGMDAWIAAQSEEIF